MTHKTFHFNYDDLDIDLTQIEKVLGYGEGNDRDIVDFLIAEILSEQGLFGAIKAEYKICDEIEFIESDKSVTVNNVNFEIHKILFGQLKKAGAIAFFLCTAGPEIGVRSRKSLAEGDPLKGYIYDMLGSIAVDAAADLMQAELEKTIVASGKKITNRYSPGYCGWHVSEQHKLFRLFPENYCGIRLTDSALMHPIKSISGIIGIGRNVRYIQNTCSLCEMKQCSYRDLKERK
jgi:hypothetical protein